jgi:hypothetical protein
MGQNWVTTDLKKKTTQKSKQKFFTSLDIFLGNLKVKKHLSGAPFTELNSLILRLTILVIGISVNDKFLSLLLESCDSLFSLTMKFWTEIYFFLKF